MEITRGVVLSLVCSFAALTLHLALNLFRKGRQAHDPVFLELLRQARLSLAAWSIMFILYVYLFFSPPGSIGKLLSVAGGGGLSAAYIYGAVLYTALCFIYLTAYYFFDRSVSATLLEIIEDSPQGALSCPQVKEAYGVKSKYHSELSGMRSGGFIVEKCGKYRNTVKGRLHGRIALITKAVLKLGPGG